MGIPKFFKWMAERYPLVITSHKGDPPLVDNLYLDMNGIIHNCSHCDNDAKGVLFPSKSELEITQNIFIYLEKIFDAIQPAKYFFLAVDGVAPRAKINQQRQRRFRSGMDLINRIEEAKKCGEDIEDESNTFDSNCITPCTDFMIKLSDQFHYFIQYKVQSDVRWRACKVIFSGCNQAGEGEHKIVEFIRGRKCHPDYSGNETHCIYGMDADIILLGLAIHEPRSILLREVVKFGLQRMNPEEKVKNSHLESMGATNSKQFSETEDGFVLFHINVLRDYLKIELVDRLKNTFREELGDDALKGHFVNNLNFENIIDDFVFMSFFFGNDFLPSLPTVGIFDGHWDTIFELYRNCVLKRNCYLTQPGGRKIFWDNVEKMLEHLGEMEFNVILKREAAEKSFKERMANSINWESTLSEPTVPGSNIMEYKQRHYGVKLGFVEGWNPQGEDIQKLIFHYLEGLMWTLQYYYQGTPSWRWYYPYHYAPMISDMKNIKEIASRIEFVLSKPLTPFQQLLACLPPISRKFLPKPYHPLITSESSILHPYFPSHVSIDREGTLAPWEGIVLLPIISEEDLLEADASVNKDELTIFERNCNTQGRSILFKFNSSMEKPFELKSDFETFPRIPRCTVDRIFIDLPSCDNFKPELCKKYIDTETEGWSSLTSKRDIFNPLLKTGIVNIFGMRTRKQSMMLEFDPLKTTFKTALDLENFIGKTFLCGYPHYRRCTLISASDATMTVRLRKLKTGPAECLKQPYRSRAQEQAFLDDCENHKKSFQCKCGITLEEVRILLTVRPFQGMLVKHVDGSKLNVVQNFEVMPTIYPVEICVPLDNIQFISDLRYTPRTLQIFEMEESVIYIGSHDGVNNTGSNGGNGKLPLSTSLSSALTAAGFLMGEFQPTAGMLGKVVPITNSDGRVSVRFQMHMIKPKIPESIREENSSAGWVSIDKLAEQYSISRRVLDYICSSLRLSAQYGQLEIGLCLIIAQGRDEDSALTRLGYAKFSMNDNNPWYKDGTDVFELLEQNAKNADHFNYPDKQKETYTNHIRHSRNLRTPYFSAKGIKLIAQYLNLFKPFINYLEISPHSMKLDAIMPQMFCTEHWADLKPEDVARQIADFVQTSGISTVPMIRSSDDALNLELIAELENSLVTYESEVTPLSNLAKMTKEVEVKVHPSSLLFSSVKKMVDDKTVIASLNIPGRRYRIGCRVVNCRDTGGAPFGAAGTVVRLLGTTDAEVVFDNIFLTGTLLNGKLNTARGGIVKLKHLLPIASSTSGSPLSPVASPSSQVFVDVPQSATSPETLDSTIVTHKAKTMTPSLGIQTFTKSAMPTVMKISNAFKQQNVNDSGSNKGVAITLPLPRSANGNVKKPQHTNVAAKLESDLCVTFTKPPNSSCSVNEFLDLVENNNNVNIVKNEKISRDYHNPDIKKIIINNNNSSDSKKININRNSTAQSSVSTFPAASPVFINDSAIVQSQARSKSATAVAVGESPFILDGMKGSVVMTKTSSVSKTPPSLLTQVINTNNNIHSIIAENEINFTVPSSPIKLQAYLPFISHPRTTAFSAPSINDNSANSKYRNLFCTSTQNRSSPTPVSRHPHSASSEKNVFSPVLPKEVINNKANNNNIPFNTSITTATTTVSTSSVIPTLIPGMTRMSNGRTYATPVAMTADIFPPSRQLNKSNDLADSELGMLKGVKIGTKSPISANEKSMHANSTLLLANVPKMENGEVERGNAGGEDVTLLDKKIIDYMFDNLMFSYYEKEEF